jgi:hypothetical protein
LLAVTLVYPVGWPGAVLEIRVIADRFNFNRLK